MAAYKNSTTLQGDVVLASYLAWIAALEACLLGAGWVQTADTGQAKSNLTGGITGTTIAALPGNYTTNYQIWRMADSLQGTTPVFIKFLFGNTATSNMGFDFDIGTGSNGSGAITGAKKSGGQCRQNAGTGNTTAYRCNLAADTNRLACVFFSNAAALAHPIVFSIERSHNDDGTDSPLGVSLVWLNASAQLRSHFLAFSGGTVSENSGIPNPAGTGVTTGVDGADVYVISTFPVYLRTLNPNKNLFIYYKADITEETTFAVSVYGQSVNYKALGGIFSAISPITSGASFLLIWV